jgi:hypothetical protein
MFLFWKTGVLKQNTFRAFYGNLNKDKWDSKNSTVFNALVI